MFQCIICDPDQRKFEGTSLGLFYTAISRATTLGDNKGYGSAIYFDGEDFNAQRIRNIGKRLDAPEQEYERVINRKNWTEYLQCNVRTTSLSQKKAKRLLLWATTTTLDYDTLYARIRQYVQQRATTEVKIHIPKATSNKRIKH